MHCSIARKGGRVMSVKWTADQKAAIEARGGGVIVSAAAGSGKTAVLTRRVLNLITRKQSPSSLDRLLMVTYSNAAAAEMRHRIGRHIAQELLQSPDNAHLMHQQMLLENAHICTIHAFCLDLLRNHFVAAGLSEDFRLSDEQELAVLRSEVLGGLLDRQYASDNPRFIEMVELISTTKNDKRVEQTILKFYDFVRSHPFYGRWLEEKKGLYDPAIPFVQSEWGRVLLDYAAEGLDYMADLLQSEARGMDEQIKTAYGEAFMLDATLAQQWAELARRGEWDELVIGLRGYKPQRLGVLKGYEYPEKKQKAQRSRDKVKAFFSDLAKKYCTATQHEHRQDMEFISPRVETLFDIVMQFDEEFSAAKRERKLVDFSDLEHMALSLLVEQKDGEYVAKSLAQKLSFEFDEILIDEYQDTNEVQEMLFVTLSKGEQNLFFVGDVKQSIYRFRQAVPQLFLTRRDNSALYDGEQFPAKILLRSNFRSRRGVTDAVNDMFTAIMSPQVGEMAYTAEEQLVCGAVYPDSLTDLRTELRLIDTGDSPEHSRVLQANYVADYVSSLLQSRMTVGSGEECRPIEPGDICILLRSVKGRADDYLSALTAREIPAMADVDSGFLTTSEVSAVVSLLEVVDNPLLDLSLAKALMSPIFDMSSDDLAAIRLSCPHDSLYTALLTHARSDKKCADAIKLLEQLGRYAAAHSADKVILKMYELTGFLQTARVMPWGAQRQSNLRLLIDYAREYELRGFRGLSGFLGFIKRLLEQEKDLPAGFCQNSGAVSVMTIHRSKGLEFPVVILADLDKGFNKLDLRGSTLLHSRLGFACKRREGERMIEYTTLPLAALRLSVEAEQLSEEMRILYVAMTRAKEKLVLTAAMDKPQSKLKDLMSAITPQGGIPPWEVRGAGCYFDWIAMMLLGHPDGEVLRRVAGGMTADNSRKGEVFAVYCESYDGEEQVFKVPEPFELPPPDPELIKRLAKNAEFIYPYAPSVNTPTKFAISRLTHGREGGFDTPKRPAFLGGEELTATQRGEATHKFMQYADYEAAGSDAVTELERLIKCGYLSPEEGKGVDLEQISQFFRSQLALRIQRAQTVYREYSFMGELSADELAQYTDAVQGEEHVVLQGIADCIIIEGDKATVIDYKTDRVKTPNILIRRYKAQLELYRRLLAPSLGCEVAQCLIYSFHLGQGIIVE